MHKPCSKEINFVRCMKCKKIFQCSRNDTAILLEHIRTDHPETYRDHQSKSKFNTKPRTSDVSVDGKSWSFSKEPEKPTKINQESEADADDVQCQCYCCDEEYDKTKPKLAKDIDLTQYSLTSEILDKYPEIQECEFFPEEDPQTKHSRRYKVHTSTAASNSSMHSPQKCHLYRTSIEKWRPANGTIYCPKCGCNKRPLVKTRAERISSNQCGACCLLSCWPFCFLPCLLPGQNIEYLHCSKCQNFLGIYDRNTNCVKPNRLFTNDEEQPHEDKDSVCDISTTYPENDSQRLPSVVIDGKELSPDMVARLQKFKKLGSLVGIDLEACTDKESSNIPNRNDSFKEAPSVDKKRKDNGKDYA